MTFLFSFFTFQFPLEKQEKHDDWYARQANTYIWSKSMFYLIVFFQERNYQYQTYPPQCYSVYLSYIPEFVYLCKLYQNICYPLFFHKI